MACIFVSKNISNQWRLVDSVSWNHGHKKSSLSHWRWNFHISINEVPSLTIKMAGVLLINKEEQLSAMPLDNHGVTWVCISNEPQLVNQESTKKSRRVDGRRTYNCPNGTKKNLTQGKVLLNGLRALTGKSDKPPLAIFVTSHFNKIKEHYYTISFAWRHPFLIGGGHHFWLPPLLPARQGSRVAALVNSSWRRSPQCDRLS